MKTTIETPKLIEFGGNPIPFSIDILEQLEIMLSREKSKQINADLDRVILYLMDTGRDNIPTDVWNGMMTILEFKPIIDICFRNMNMIKGRKENE